MDKASSRKEELGKKYGIDFDKLEKEQTKLAKGIETKDKIPLSEMERFGAFDTFFIKNKILSCCIVCDKNYEIIDQAYIIDKIRFPYVPGFRNYRELPAMMAAFEKLNEKPDVMFISAQGIIHPRLGLASHFGLASGMPTIGISDMVIDCEVEEKKDGKEILKGGKKVGKVLIGKEGSSPLYVSPGNHISVKTAYDIAKKLILPPHKRPEPLHIASKYLKKVKEEIIHEITQ